MALGPPDLLDRRTRRWRKHFSGTATYRRPITIPAVHARPGRRLYLDLGRVEVIAEVRLNGHDLGILWKPPFRVDITERPARERTDLEVRVVNLWPNRLIGDDRLPPDAEWTGPRMKSWPQWHLDGKPSPTGRLTFSPRKHWGKHDPLLDSGLLGPVRIEATARQKYGSCDKKRPVHAMAAHTSLSQRLERLSVTFGGPTPGSR